MTDRHLEKIRLTTPPKTPRFLPRSVFRPALGGLLVGAATGALLFFATSGWAGTLDSLKPESAAPDTQTVEADAAPRLPAAIAGVEFRLSTFESDSYVLLFDGIVFLVSLPILWWMLHRSRRLNDISSPGFEIITHSERRRFIPLEEKFQHMDFLSNVETRGSLRLSANLNKVNLSFRRYGHLLEDKNFRNALLVNRRRVRRTLLRDGDVLDLGDLTLLYRDNREVPITRHSAITPREGKVQVRFERLRGPVRRGTPMLVSETQPNRSFFVTKNLVFIGRSERNDLIIKSQSVDYRHAKIERIGSRYKLINLSTAGNTFVNNRRIEQRFLKEGDEVSIDNQRFKFRLASKAVSEAPRTQSAPREVVEDEGNGPGTDEDANATSDGQDQLSSVGS